MKLFSKILKILDESDTLAKHDTMILKTKKKV